MYDTRIILDAVQRYGQACFDRDCAGAGVLFGEITRMVTDEGMMESIRHDVGLIESLRREETAAPPEEDAAVLVAGAG